MAKSFFHLLIENTRFNPVGTVLLLRACEINRPDYKIRVNEQQRARGQDNAENRHLKRRIRIMMFILCGVCLTGLSMLMAFCSHRL
jgi:hypothetical protein